jgi:hypothetical protein
MEHWLPFSKKRNPPAPVNYNPLFSRYTEGYYAQGGQVKVHQHKAGGGDPRELKSANPLVREGFIDYPKAYEALWYNFGKGLRNKPAKPEVVHNGRSLEQVNNLDSSNYYNFVK